MTNADDLAAKIIAADGALYTQKGPATLPEMTGPEIQEYLKATDVVLIPVGATEDHGAHLPLGTDSMEAREICRRTALRLANEGCPVVIGPVIPFGTSSFHMGFPGTVSISSSTLITLLKEVCLSLHQGGFRNFCLIHGHDGNLSSMMVAAQEIVDATEDASAVVLNWMVALSEVYHTIQKSKKGESHGGEGETARLLVTHPELVHPERGTPFYLKPEELRKIQSPEHMKTGGGIYYGVRSYKALTPFGHIGDPAMAEPETGDKGYDAIADWLTMVIKRDFFDEREFRV
jgi:creatinine amidohydrolase